MLGLFNKQKEVKPKHQTKREFWYRLDPEPFELLIDQERDQLEGNLLELLHQLDRGTIIVRSDTQNSYMRMKFTKCNSTGSI
jgi:hypothetical protein